MKMKDLFLIVFIFAIPALAQGQTAITYDEVIELEGVSKDDLFNRGNHWMINVFKDPNKVIQLKDKEGGQIIGKGNFSYKQSKNGWGASIQTEGVVNFTVKLFFKEGRYRYILTDFTHDANWPFGLVTDASDCGCKFPLANKKWKWNIWNDLKEQINAKVETIVNSLESSMKKKTGVDDEW